MGNPHGKSGYPNSRLLGANKAQINTLFLWKIKHNRRDSYTIVKNFIEGSDADGLRYLEDYYFIKQLLNLSMLREYGIDKKTAELLNSAQKRLYDIQFSILANLHSEVIIPEAKRIYGAICSAIEKLVDEKY